MTPDFKAKLRRSLIKHEGYETKPYLDTVGKVSIGIGYNLTDRGMEDEWINTQYEKDVEYFYHQLSQFHWFKHMNLDRQIVLIDMCFMGWKHFLSFTKMLKCLANYDYTNAAKEMLDSKWAQQVGTRADHLSRAMHSGVYEI